MEFEDILKQVGGSGRYQRNLTLFFMIPMSCVIPWFWLNFILMVSVPDHWCYIPELESSNLSVTELRTLISPPDDPMCSMYDTNFSLLSGVESSVLYNNSMKVIPCTAGWQYDKENYDSTAATSWNMVCDKDHLPSLLLTLRSFGSLIGTVIYGLLSDKFGRRLVFLLLVFLTFITELPSIFVNNFILFAILRTINGSVIPTIFVGPYILITEIVAPHMRAHINGIVNCGWTIGLSIFPLIAYLSRSWIIMSIISSISALLLLLYWSYIPESPSWLISRERYEEATDIMMKIGSTNGKHLDRALMLSQLQTLGAEIKKKKEEEKKVSGSQVLKYPRLRRNFFVLTLCWFAFNVGYYGFTFNVMNLDGNEFMNFFLLAVVEIPGNLAFWFLMDRCGRRWTNSIGFILIGITCIFPLIDFKHSDIISSSIGKFLVSGIYMVSDQQGMELFPTSLRSFGFGFGKSLAVGCSMFMPYVAYLSIYGKGIPYIFIGVTSFITGLCASFLPETVDANLPQTISDAEDFGKNKKFFSWIKRKEKSSKRSSMTISVVQVPLD